VALQVADLVASLSLDVSGAARGVAQLAGTLDKADAALGHAGAQGTAMGQKIQTGASQAAAGMGRLGEMAQRVLETFTGFALATAFERGVEKIKAFVQESAKLGLEAKVQEDAFARMTQAIGVAGDTLLAQLQAASGGILNQSDIMTSAARALQEALNPDQIVNLMTIARQAAKLAGTDVATAFNAITDAIANQQVRGLKAMGIVIDLTQAQDKYARQLNTSADALSIAGQAQAIYQAVAEKGAPLVRALATATRTQSEELQAAAAAWKQFKEDLGKVFVDIEIALLRSFGDLPALLERVKAELLTFGQAASVNAARVLDVLSPMALAIVGIFSGAWTFFRGLPSWVQEAGLVAAVFGGAKGTAVMLGLLALADRVTKSAEALSKGMSVPEWITAGPKEIDAFLAQFQTQVQTGVEGMSLDPEGSFARKVQEFFAHLKEEMAKGAAGAGAGGAPLIAPPSLVLTGLTQVLKENALSLATWAKAVQLGVATTEEYAEVLRIAEARINAVGGNTTQAKDAIADLAVAMMALSAQTLAEDESRRRQQLGTTLAYLAQRRHALQSESEWEITLAKATARTELDGLEAEAAIRAGVLARERADVEASYSLEVAAAQQTYELETAAAHRSLAQRTQDRLKYDAALTAADLKRAAELQALNDQEQQQAAAKFAALTSMAQAFTQEMKAQLDKESQDFKAMWDSLPTGQAQALDASIAQLRQYLATINQDSAAAADLRIRILEQEEQRRALLAERGVDRERLINLTRLQNEANLAERLANLQRNEADARYRIAVADAERMGSAYDVFVLSFGDAMRRAGDTMSALKTLADQTAQAITTGFSDFFFDVFQGKVTDLESAWKNMLTAFERALANFLSSQAVNQLGNLFTTLTGGTTPSATPSPGSSGGGFWDWLRHLGGADVDTSPGHDSPPTDFWPPQDTPQVGLELKRIDAALETHTVTAIDAIVQQIERGGTEGGAPGGPGVPGGVTTDSGTSSSAGSATISDASKGVLGKIATSIADTLGTWGVRAAATILGAVLGGPLGAALGLAASLFGRAIWDGIKVLAQKVVAWFTGADPGVDDPMGGVKGVLAHQKEEREEEAAAREAAARAAANTAAGLTNLAGDLDILGHSAAGLGEGTRGAAGVLSQVDDDMGAFGRQVGTFGDAVGNVGNRIDTDTTPGVDKFGNSLAGLAESMANAVGAAANAAERASDAANRANEGPAQPTEPGAPGPDPGPSPDPGPAPGPGGEPTAFGFGGIVTRPLHALLGERGTPEGVIPLDAPHLRLIGEGILAAGGFPVPTLVGVGGRADMAGDGWDTRSGDATTELTATIIINQDGREVSREVRAVRLRRRGDPTV